MLCADAFNCEGEVFRLFDPFVEDLFSIDSLLHPSGLKPSQARKT